MFSAFDRRFVGFAADPAVLVLLQPFPLELPRHEAADNVADPRHLTHCGISEIYKVADFFKQTGGFITRKSLTETLKRYIAQHHSIYHAKYK